MLMRCQAFHSDNVFFLFFATARFKASPVLLFSELFLSYISKCPPLLPDVPPVALQPSRQRVRCLWRLLKANRASLIVAKVEVDLDIGRGPSAGPNVESSNAAGSGSGGPVDARC